jgi:hypothetical protein
LWTVAAASLFGCGGDNGTAGAAGAGGEDALALACPPHFADCDGDPTNGCEGALSTSPDNCGACGVKCQARDHEAPLCSAGACIHICEVDFADCNGDPADGCEVDVARDVVHCGGCERSCKTSCEKGVCDVITLATGQAQPAAIAVDDTSVYWANMAELAAGGGSIMKVAKAGGAPSTLAEKQSAPGSIALDGASIYWVNIGTPPLFADGAVLTAAKDGSGAPVEIIAGQAAPYGIAVQGSTVYWTTTAEVLMIDKDNPSAQPVVLASGQNRPFEIVAVGSLIYWVNRGTQTGDVANPDGSVMMLSTGGSPVVLAENLTLASGLTLDTVGAYLYFRVRGAIMRLPRSGGPAEVFLDGFDAVPWQIAADATTVYWTEAGRVGGIMSAPSVSPKQKTPLVPNQTYLWGIALDQTSVYWSTSGDGNPMTGSIAKIDR